MESIRQFFRQIMAGDRGLLWGLVAIAGAEVISAAASIIPARRSNSGRGTRVDARRHQE